LYDSFFFVAEAIMTLVTLPQASLVSKLIIFDNLPIKKYSYGNACEDIKATDPIILIITY